MTSEALPRSWRLARAADIQAVAKEGHRRRTPNLDISWRPNELGHPRLGVVVPRFGRTAVTRNRLRRRLREACRRQVLPHVGPTDLLVRSRQSAYQSQFHEMARELNGWLRSL